ncbi:flagellar biosynthesis protein FlhA [Christensenellaceae bacterium OttesenSCG-928-M15]|nr:flagellar biosynthesis protein FlhA [Christensenellaceae bacterium OttesenSCG-928-M15]
MKASDIIIAIVIVGIVMLLILPIGTAMMDIFLVINIAASLMVLLMTVYITEPLQFASFPTVLLMLTIYRLALNISSTTLILGNNGDAGDVIKTFANFVIGDNMIVGLIIFIIIVIVNFVVITKGAERVAEVAARFTLDAMPGKQMAIDADLNSGLIDEQQAKERRNKIQREADFYGAMDGASKFVKGDAIVGILITLVNIIAGLIIGMTGDGGMTTAEVIDTYLIATVGDGLSSQIPALLISTSMGIIVTRSTSENNLGRDLAEQFGRQPYLFYILGGILVVFSIIPGMPTFPILVLSAGFFALGYMLMRKQKLALETPEEEVDVHEEAAQEMRKPEKVTSLLQVDLIGVELGYGLLPLVDASQGGDLLERVVMIRRQCVMDLGIIVPVIRLRDNIQLNSSEYVIKIRGIEVAKGEVMLDHFLALSTGEVLGKVDGIETVEPTFGLPALWVTEANRERAELMGYTTIDPPSVIATHMTDVIKRHSAELLTRQQVQILVDNLKQQQPALVDEVIPKLFSLGELQKILASLLRENVSIRDLGTILETLGDYDSITRDLDTLTEYVRQALGRAISKRFIPDNRARVITVDASVEKLMLERMRKSEQGAYVALDQKELQSIYVSLKNALDKVTKMGLTPIIVSSPAIRRHFKRLTEQIAPDFVVLSYNEIGPDVEIIAEGVVSV